MKLKLQNLQSVVQRVVKEEKILSLLREEVLKSVGPSVIVENKDAEVICWDVMGRLDVLEARNERPGKFEPSLAVAMLEHRSVGVRCLGARLAPVGQLHRVINDKSSQVRCEVAKRVDLTTVKEMSKRHPGDDSLRFILEAREEDAVFDMYGDDRLGDVVKQQDEHELSDLWYESLARKMIEDYEHQTEGTWRHTAVNQYVSSVKAASGVEIDPEKLLEAIDKLIEDRDEDMLSRKTLRESIDMLDRQVMSESTFFTMGEEDSDIVSDLMNSRLGPVEYIARAQEVFSVTEGRVSRAVARLALTEGVSTTFQVPVSAELPHGDGFRSVDERALDLYVECWNKRRNLEGNPLRISWSVDPTVDSGVTFDTSVR